MLFLVDVPPFDESIFERRKDDAEFFFGRRLCDNLAEGFDDSGSVLSRNPVEQGLVFMLKGTFE